MRIGKLAACRYLYVVLAIACLGVYAPAVEPGSGPKSPKVKSAVSLFYPEAARVDHVDDYHGVRVADPYRWLEDPRSPQSSEWIEAENALTEKFLSSIPQRQAVHTRLKQIWNYERYGVPKHQGENYFYTHNDGLQNQSVLYVAQSLDAESRVLLDPNKLSEDGTTSLAGYEPSDDGRLLAYGISVAGSDWREWKVRDVASGEDLEDHLKWIKFSGVSWLPDGSGFYYSRYDEPNEETRLEDANYYQKLYLHKIGTPQSQDELIYQRPDEKEWGFDGTVSEDGDWLIITVWQGTERKNAVFYQNLREQDGTVVELLNKFDAQYYYLGNQDNQFWFYTDNDAPRGRVVAVNLQAPEPKSWNELVPESKDALRDVSVIGDRFFCTYLQDAQSRVKSFSLEGEHLSDVQLPGVGTVAGFEGRREDQQTFYAFSRFTSPTTVYRYDVVSGESTVFRQPEVDFDPDDYQTEQVFYTSRDGTRVPMFISRRRDLPADGPHPTILYGYGGFNIAITPQFSPKNLVWMEMGGVLAVPNLRGGGEYGRSWHEAGRLSNKQNVFDDFISAANWLIDNKHTTRDKLAISGRSNGGLLVGACMTQRPDLFGAALPGVGVMDMLRFHKFTIGWAWVPEYGSADEAEQFKNLYAYSPLHNIKPGTEYPATLITTADHDDRVVPAHSFKFAATLQAAQEGDNPILIRIETSAGHGAGTPTSKQIEEAADSLAFLVKTLNMQPRLKESPAGK